MKPMVVLLAKPWVCVFWGYETMHHRIPAMSSRAKWVRFYGVMFGNAWIGVARGLRG